MLAIVSDFHLSDGTAVPAGWNVNERAVELLLGEIYEQARKRQVRQLDLVFLGDMLDPIRSEVWLEVPLAERPWADASALDGDAPLSPAATLHARAITQRIIDANRAALEVLSGARESGVSGSSLRPPCPVRRIFIPGNHDRLYLLDDGIRAMTRRALGTVDERLLGGEGIFQNRLVLPEYGLLARHGHEWDPWNFEGYRDHADPNEYTESDYRRTPMGDPITTELIVALPCEVERRLRESGQFDEEFITRARTRLQRIEDVRPLLSAFAWVFYETERIGKEALDPARERLLHDVLTGALRDLGTRFAALPYYRAWHERHDRFGLDRADVMATVLRTMRSLSIGTLSSLVAALHRVVGFSDDGDAVAAGAGHEPRLTSCYAGGLRFVVYGHTHNPLMRAMARARAGGSPRHTDLYLNTGTWRDRVHATDDGRDFAHWRQATYAIFYSEEENQPLAGERRIGPAFDTWTGFRSNE